MLMENWLILLFKNLFYQMNKMIHKHSKSIKKGEPDHLYQIDLVVKVSLSQ